jgi:multidrug efflux pump subunit AcrB
MLAGYLGVVALLVGWWLIGHPGLGMEIFPKVDAGQFQLRLRAPDGTPLGETEALARDVLNAIADEVGPENVDISVSLVGTASYNYPINSIYLWTSGPQEAVLRVALKPGSGIRIEELKERLRAKLPNVKRDEGPSMKDVQFSFEAGDIVQEVMSFGSPTPVEVTVNGPSLADDRAYAAKVREQLEKIPSLTDLHYAQSLDYPALYVTLDRELLGRSGGTVANVADALPAVTLSSRFVSRNFWRDPKTGIGYQVQVQVPQVPLKSKEDFGTTPIATGESGKQLLLRDFTTFKDGTAPGEIDRYNMRRVVSLTANIEGEDLGRVAGHLDQALKAAGAPPAGATVEVRGQVVPMRQMFNGLATGMVLAVLAILFLLTANFQSPRLALVVVSTVPAVIAGVAVALVITRTTLNIQSFMGAIMAIGVAVANAILLVTFAERARREGSDPAAAAVDGGQHRLRPILMTSCAMIAGMVPMALALGEGGEQTAPLARAVIGGLAVATFATLTILPTVFAVVQGRSRMRSVSLDPDDPESEHFDRQGAAAERDGTPRSPAPSTGITAGS